MSKVVSIEPVLLDLAAPTYRVGPDAGNPPPTAVQITRNLVVASINARFGNGMSAEEARKWAQFQDAFAEGAEKIEVSRGDFRWLYGIVTADDLRLHPGLSSWRVSFLDYLAELKESAKQPLPQAATPE